jgi:CheY-like chemotaxis protein
LLDGLRILILEDEFLIAMDVEQLCRDNGAADTTIARSLVEIGDDDLAGRFDAAIVDLVLDGISTLDFAERLRDQKVPFVFASGYSDSAELRAAFPDVQLVGKPYVGTDLIEALAAACGRLSACES